MARAQAAQAEARKMSRHTRAVYCRAAARRTPRRHGGARRGDSAALRARERFKIYA